MTKTVLFYASISVLGMGLMGCSGDKASCQEGMEGCACFPNWTCAGSLVCGPAGRCEQLPVDASIEDASVPDGGAQDATAVSCDADDECDTGTETRGYLCVDGTCQPCTEHADCEASIHYGDGAVCKDDGRCQSAESCVQVGCPDGGLCDTMSGRCREPFTCDEIGCALGQLCRQATAGQDAQCLDECEEGRVWNGIDGTCDIIPDNCRTDWANSILDRCNEQFRSCVEMAGGAQCGDCFMGYLEDAGVCRPVVTCEELSCSDEGRVCLPESSHADAVCGTCLPGFGEHFGQCEQQEGATCDSASSDSILSACAAQGRSCEEASGGAACGPCISGRVENPSTGACEVEVTCADLDCTFMHRACEETYNGHCTDCLDGYVEDPATGGCVCAPGSLPDDNGACETIRTCADIQAECNAQSMVCIEATDRHHAYCAHCPAGQTWYEHQQTCLLCPPCTKPGETGQLWPVASQMGHCICETQSGYYHSEAGLGGTFSCDQDGDGWVTADARLAMEAPEGSAVRDNARCTLRRIDRVLLRNEWGEEKEILLSDFDFLWDAVPLYEPANRDRDDKLVNDYDYTNALMHNYAPALGDNGRALTAAELNPFTKACATGSANPHARYADYNADGHPDVDDPGWKDDRSDPEARIFAMFSYFLELYRGWYEPSEGGDDEPGRWVIQEKTRSLYGRRGNHVPLTYPPGRVHWRTCRRHTDSSFSASGPVYGLDFAQFGEEESCDWSGTSPGSWCGFNHHSQFKCMLAVSSSDRDPAYPHHEVPAEIVSQYQVNQCDAISDSWKPTLSNPSSPVLQCHLGSMPHAGSLVWAAAKYADYGHDDAPNDAYVRGCVNECAEVESLPPDMRCQGVPTPSCRGLVDDYGKLFCYRPVQFVTLPLAGHSFVMGSPPSEAGRHDDETAHVVNFTDDHAYYGLMVMSTEVTQDQFEEYMGFNPSRFDCGNSVCPVEQVTWFDALAFANVLSDREGLPRCYDFEYRRRRFAELRCADGTLEHQYDPQTGVYLGTWCRDHGGVADLVSDGLESYDAAGWSSHSWRCDGYRLPTEAEWEYLARADSQTALWNGDMAVLDCNQDPAAAAVAWTCADGGFGPHAVGLKLPNPFGLYDMNGNVWEWTSDEYEADRGQAETNPDLFPDSTYSNYLVTARGGSWNRGVQDARSARRQGYAPGGRNYAVGFRLVRTVFEYDYRHYQLVTIERTWADAEQDCVNRGGHLASIANLAEQQMIAKAVFAFDRQNGTNYGVVYPVWLGLNDRQIEGQWVWSDGSAYSPPGFWAHYEPDGGTRENCVCATAYDLQWQRAWVDLDCSTLRPYVCEMP